MHKAQDVLGLPVIDLSTGSEIGVVQDLFFDADHVFRGVMLEANGWFHRGRFIRKESIFAVGKDCVTIRNAHALTSLRASDFTGLVTGNKPLKGKPVITPNGLQLGQVEDVYFHEELGTIVGYELSDGFVTDILEGRKFLRHPGRVIHGEDALIVPAAKGKGPEDELVREVKET
ncbi:PRC-barrel domain-containing protein [Bacillaceae bacterium]